jgi:translation initiation factor IF-3
LRINREIRADRLRVVTEDGEQLGILALRDALLKAEEAGLDLVEIAPTAKPPVAKIIDYGKYRYLQQKKEKDSKKSQVQIKVKEIKFKPNIDTHDFQTKVNHAREFLSKGNKVRVTCVFRGREMLHLELGENVINEFYRVLSGVAAFETPPKLLGRAMSAVLAPTVKRQKSVIKRTEQGENSRAKNEDSKSG